MSYRDSVLTMLLRASFDGPSAVSVVVSVREESQLDAEQGLPRPDTRAGVHEMAMLAENGRTAPLEPGAWVSDALGTLRVSDEGAKLYGQESTR